MATIYEIAKEVGLSPSTVSRALRGTGYCSRENIEKVRAAAKRLNYVPSHAAKALKNRRTKRILFCIPDICNPFYFLMIKGASDVFEAHGYFLVLAYTKGSLHTEVELIQSLGEGYADGMILVSFDFNKKNIGAINASGFPVVLTNNYQSLSEKDRFDCVYIDTCDGIYRACKYFADSGYQRIGYIGGDTSVQTGRERFDGFLKAMQEGDLPVDQRLLREGDFSRGSGEAAMRSMFRAEHVPDALVVANDLMAIGALKVCQQQGLRVPQDMAIIGMDNSDMATATSPELSSIIMREEEIGRHAATLLLERIEDGRTDKRTIRLEPRLCLRASTLPQAAAPRAEVSP